MKKIVAHIMCILVLQMVGGWKLYGQVVVTHTSPQSIQKLTDVFNLNLENNMGISSYVYMEIEITEENYGYLGTVKSDKLLLPLGATLIDPSLITLSSRSFSNLDYASYIKNQGVFAPGNYRLNISLKSATDNNVLALTMVVFKVDKMLMSADTLSSNTPAKTSGFYKNVKLSGNAEVLGYFSSGQPATSLTPPSYLQMNLSPQLSIFDVPIGARIFVTTQQNSGMQSMNYFRLNFDANAFRGMLMKRLMDMVNKKANLDKMNLSNFDSYKTELANINQTLKNPAVLQEMGQIKELDSLKQQFSSFKDKMNISDTSFAQYLNQLKDSLSTKTRDSLPAVDSLQSVYTDSIGKIKDSLMHTYEKMAGMYEKIKSMSWLDDKKQYYDQIAEKKDKIMSYGQKIGCVDSLGNFTNPIEKFDAKKYTDPANLYSALKSNKLFKKFEKYLFWIKSVNIGMHSPLYADLTMNGVNVNGFGIELEPQKFYVAFNYGEVLRPVITTNLINANYKRNLWSFKVGYGRLEDSHIHLSMLSATDDSMSVNPRDSLYLYNKLPQDNKVIGLDFKLTLFKKKLSISGELAGSQTIRDLTYNSSLFNFVPVINGSNGGVQNNNNWFVNIFTQQGSDMNRQVDYAVQCKVEGRFFPGSVITASFSRVGPQFQSFGLPFLMKDRMIGELKAAQKFWKGRISLSGFFRYNVDNLDSTKGLTTQFINYGFDLRLNIPKFPSLAVSLTPVTLQNDSATISMNILNANCYHTINFKKWSLTGILNYVYQSSAQNNGVGNIFNLHNVNLTTLYNFGQFSINNTLTYMNNVTATAQTNTFITSVSTSFTAFKKWTNTIGGNLYVNDHALKGGGFYQTSLSLVKNLVFNVRIETNRFNTYVFMPGYQDYTQFLCRTSIQYKW